MNRYTDQTYLQTEQYRTAVNLNARQQLHALFSTNPENWFQWVFDQGLKDTLPRENQARLLEVGCGPGDFWRNNLARLGADWEIILSDFSPGMAAQARRLLIEAIAQPPAHGFPFRFCVVDAQHIPFPNESFDLVIANHCLYHVPDLNLALAQFRRILRPGGKLLAATNGQNHMGEMYQLAERFLPGCANAVMGRLSFNLENGAALLSAWFASVRLERHANALKVTQAQPFLDYLFSMGNERCTPGDLNSTARRDQAVDLRAFLEAELRAQGAIHITKDVGLFIAAK